MFSNKYHGVSDSMLEAVKQVIEKELVGGQKKLDKNHNGKLDSQDFKMLRKEDKKCGCEGNCKCSTNEEIEQVDEAATPLHRVYLRQTTARHKSVHGVDANGKVKTLSGPTNFMDAASTAEKHAKKHGLVKHDGEWTKSANEETEQVDELTGIKKSPMKKIGYVMKAGEVMTKTAPHEIANNKETGRKFKNRLDGLQNLQKRMTKEEIEFSEEEIARIEAIAKEME